MDMFVDNIDAFGLVYWNEAIERHGEELAKKQK